MVRKLTFSGRKKTGGVAIVPPVIVLEVPLAFDPAAAPVQNTI